ncbi:MAG: rhodanese-like domain-containing protein [Candidatus Diapherotrites archaeon]|nr:rhodanese-like domain-containing protein [Candidatus Diapherotrites archaeon]
MLASAVVGALAALTASNFLNSGNSGLISDFYATEVAVSVSPSDFINHLKTGQLDGLLVDLRSQKEYEKAHLVTAVNVPAGGMSAQQLVLAFNNLPKDKPFITYCYSSYCMLSKNVGKKLAENGIYAKHLTAGWYEINRDFNDYIIAGKGPGILKTDGNYPIRPCQTDGSGELSC